MHVDQNTVALVTGAGSGIGKALAEALASRGAKTLCADVKPHQAETVVEAIRAAGGQAAAITLDVSCFEAWQTVSEAIVAEHGPVDLICNNAGITCPKSPVGEIDTGDWERMLATNLSSTFYGSRCFLSTLYRGSGPGHIVNTASVCGLVTGPNSGAYIASKFGVVGLTESLYFETRDSEVSVSMLCPGFAQTNLAAISKAETALGTNSAALDNGMKAEDVAACVLDGIEHDRLYITTHAEYLEVVRTRHHAIEAALGSTQRTDGRADDPSVLAAGWVEDMSRG